ncbi:hypothetical protein [Neobacillus jeddahensis]|uniref:hypothetical protein n=1 Tax=Neobacillus jeddahensis TaxID=1461580 RepID=UPI00058C6641|nr:hypothetical protein [Neobacillus jeddahensis]
MSQQKLTIVPVTLQTEDKNTSPITQATLSSNAACTIKTATTEISFFNGIDERIIQTVMRELKHL